MGAGDGGTVPRRSTNEGDANGNTAEDCPALKKKKGEKTKGALQPTLIQAGWLDGRLKLMTPMFTYVQKRKTCEAHPNEQNTKVCP